MATSVATGKAATAATTAAAATAAAAATGGSAAAGNLALLASLGVLTMVITLHEVGHLVAALSQGIKVRRRRVGVDHSAYPRVEKQQTRLAPLLCCMFFAALSKGAPLLLVRA